MRAIRPPAPHETDELVAIAVATGLFSPDDADALLRQTLNEIHAGTLGHGHHASVVLDGGGRLAGWAYFANNDKATGVWDLWWIGVDPSRHGQGLGAALLTHVEDRARADGARILVIETSSLPALARTREFYRRRRYTECGVIPDFYADGDGKVTFARRLDERTAG